MNLEKKKNYPRKKAGLFRPLNVTPILTFLVPWTPHLTGCTIQVNYIDTDTKDTAFFFSERG